MHALHGNTPPPDIGDKIAIWWPGDGVPDGWYSGCVTGRDGRAKHIVDVEYDCDGLSHGPTIYTIFGGITCYPNTE